MSDSEVTVADAVAELLRRVTRESDSDESDGYSENESAASVPFCKTLRSYHSSIWTGKPAFIPHHIKHRPKLVAVETHLKMTNAQQAAYMGTLIAEAGEDSSKVSISYSTADKVPSSRYKEHCDSIQSSVACFQAAALGLSICLHCRAKTFPRSDLLYSSGKYP